MPLTPFQLPNPKVDQPYPIESVYARSSPNPFADQTLYMADRNLQGEQYQHELDAQHDYARNVLGVQQQQGFLEALPKILERDNGIGIAAGIPGIRELLNRLPPELLQQYVNQAFQKTQGAIFKDTGAGAESFRNAGHQFTPDELARMTGATSLAVNPLAIDKANTEGYFHVKAAEAGVRPPPVTVALPGTPTSAGLLHTTVQIPPGWTMEQTLDDARKRGIVNPVVVPPASLPPRPDEKTSLPNAPKKNMSRPGDNVLADPPAVGTSSAVAAFEPGEMPPPEDLAPIDPATWGRAWASLKGGTGGTAVDNTQAALIEEGMKRNGGKPIISKSTGAIYGMKPDGTVVVVVQPGLKKGLANK